MRLHKTKIRSIRKGFTLVELAMAMLICSIILLATASLSFAMRQGQEVTEMMTKNQVAIRTTAVRIGELVRGSVQVWMADDGDLVLWLGDTNANMQIDTSELAYVIADTAGGKIKTMTCPGLVTAVTIAQIYDGAAESTIRSSNLQTEITLASGCSNMQFYMQGSRFVVLQYQMMEESGLRDYQVCARLRGSAEAWISGSVMTAVDDD